MTVTVSMHFVNELFRGLTAAGQPPTRYLEQAGISPFLLTAPNGRVTVEQFAELYRLLAVELDDETPRFFSRPLRCGTLKLLCLSMLEAPTLQVALHRYTQFFRILLDDFGYSFTIEVPKEILGRSGRNYFLEKIRYRTPETDSSHLEGLK